ncbi:platelet binding protein GspB-like isoform X2 [Haliotis rufescens]|uniref:platelet binding protein GspB-like isoform X2 n=1 Tax=Haliotis rufescens TaxID=6454 RepID=UPI00201F6DDA|nr:platelet binding protein GspB-like isoform X2 [Haliotis rufescens]
MWRNVLYTSFVVIAGLVAHTEASCGLSAIASCSISASEMGTSTTSICRAFRKFKTCMLGLTQCDATSYIHAYENKPDLSGKTFKTMCANVAFSDTTTASAVHCDTNEMYECSSTVVTAVDGANGNTNTICAAAESYAQCLKKQTCKTSAVYLQALVTITSRNLSRTCPNVVFTDPTTPATTTTGAGSTTPGLVAHTEASCGLSAIASCSISASEMGTSTTSICRAFRKFKTCMLGLTQCDATSYIHAYENKPDLSGKTFKTMCANVAFSDTTTASAVHCDTNEMYECSSTVVTAVDGANGNTNTICAAAESYAQCLKKQTCKTSAVYLQALVTITSRNLSRTCPDVVFPDSSTPTTTTTGAGSTTPASITHCDVNEMYACSAAVVAAVDTPNAATNTICTAAEIYVECLNKQTCTTNSVYLQALRTITAKNLDTTCPAVVFPTTDSAGTVRSGIVCLLAVLLALLVR